MTMADRFVWVEWVGSDKVFYRKRFPIQGHRRWLKHLGKVIAQSSVFMIYQPIPKQKWTQKPLQILFFKHSPLDLQAIMKGAHKFAEGIKGKLTRVYVGNEYGDLKFECS